MSKQVKVAVVTGGNKGIGYAIVKGLATKFKGIVYLTGNTHSVSFISLINHVLIIFFIARNEELGVKAVADVEKDIGIKVNFHQLDIDNIDSIQKFANHLKQEHGGLDVLVNNAAIAYGRADTVPFSEQATNTIRVNFTGTLNLCNALFPLLRPHARVVNVSSRAGLLVNVKDADIKQRVSNENATVDDIVNVMNEFVELSQHGKNEHISSSAYGMSKVGVTALTKVFQRAFDKDIRPDIIINSMCPGFCKTDMTKQTGHIPPEEGFFFYLLKIVLLRLVNFLDIHSYNRLVKIVVDKTRLVNKS
jgi:carbonyl reductase 1